MTTSCMNVNKTGGITAATCECHLNELNIYSIEHLLDLLPSHVTKQDKNYHENVSCVSAQVLGNQLLTAKSEL